MAVVGGGPSGASAAEIFAQDKTVDTVLIERKMKLISPSGKEVDIGQTLAPEEYIGMTRREVLDGYLRDRAIETGAEAINGLVNSIDLPTTAQVGLLRGRAQTACPQRYV